MFLLNGCNNGVRNVQGAIMKKEIERVVGQAYDTTDDCPVDASGDKTDCNYNIWFKNGDHYLGRIQVGEGYAGTGRDGKNLGTYTRTNEWSFVGSWKDGFAVYGTYTWNRDGDRKKGEYFTSGDTYLGDFSPNYTNNPKYPIDALAPGGGTSVIKNLEGDILAFNTHSMPENVPAVHDNQPFPAKN